jgi:hypothetical protein
MHDDKDKKCPENVKNEVIKSIQAVIDMYRNTRNDDVSLCQDALINLLGFIEGDGDLNIAELHFLDERDFELLGLGDGYKIKGKPLEEFIYDIYYAAEKGVKGMTEAELIAALNGKDLFTDLFPHDLSMQIFKGKDCQDRFQDIGIRLTNAEMTDKSKSIDNYLLMLHKKVTDVVVKSSDQGLIEIMYQREEAFKTAFLDFLQQQENEKVYETIKSREDDAELKVSLGNSFRSTSPTSETTPSPNDILRKIFEYGYRKNADSLRADWNPNNTSLITAFFNPNYLTDDVLDKIKNSNKEFTSNTLNEYVQNLSQYLLNSLPTIGLSEQEQDVAKTTIEDNLPKVRERIRNSFTNLDLEYKSEKHKDGTRSHLTDEDDNRSDASSMASDSSLDFDDFDDSDEEKELIKKILRYVENNFSNEDTEDTFSSEGITNEGAHFISCFNKLSNANETTSEYIDKLSNRYLNEILTQRDDIDADKQSNISQNYGVFMNSLKGYIDRCVKCFIRDIEHQEGAYHVTFSIDEDFYNKYIKDIVETISYKTYAKRDSQRYLNNLLSAVITACFEGGDINKLNELLEAKEKESLVEGKKIKEEDFPNPSPATYYLLDSSKEDSIISGDYIKMKVGESSHLGEDVKNIYVVSEKTLNYILNFTFVDNSDFDAVEKECIRIILSKNSTLEDLENAQKIDDDTLSSLIGNLNIILHNSKSQQFTEEEKTAIKNACHKFQAKENERNKSIVRHQVNQSEDSNGGTSYNLDTRQNPTQTPKPEGDNNDSLVTNSTNLHNIPPDSGLENIYVVSEKTLNYILDYTFDHNQHFNEAEKDAIKIVLSKNSTLEDLENAQKIDDDTLSSLIGNLNNIADHRTAELAEEERKAIKDACGKFKVRAEDIKPNRPPSQEQSQHNYCHLASKKNYNKDSETSLASSAMEVSRHREKSKSTYTLINEEGKSRDVSCTEMADKMITSNSRKALMGEAEGGDVKFVYDMRNHKLSIKMVRNSEVLFKNGESIKCQNNQFIHNNPALDIYFKGDVVNNRLSENYMDETKESTHNKYVKDNKRGVTSLQQ